MSTSEVSKPSPIVISLIGCQNKGLYCSVVGKFEYQKQFDVNVFVNRYLPYARVTRKRDILQGSLNSVN